MGLFVSWHRGSSQTRDWTCVPCIGRRFLKHFTTREVWLYIYFSISTTISFLMVLEAKNPRSRWQQGWFLMRLLSLACRWLSSPCVRTWPSFCVCLCLNLFLRWFSHMRLGLIQVTSFYPNHLRKDSVFKCCRILGWHTGALENTVWIFGAHNPAHSTHYWNTRYLLNRKPQIHFFLCDDSHQVVVVAWKVQCREGFWGPIWAQEGGLMMSVVGEGVESCDTHVMGCPDGWIRLEPACFVTWL